MQKGLGTRAKRNRIVNYMDAIPEEFEVLADNLDYSDPMIKLQTKTRNIFLKCDDEGHVIEDFRMRPGAGSKGEFLAKQEAYNAIRKYYDDFYTGAKIKESSFDNSLIKIELETKIITLIYDPETECVEEKERARRGTKKGTSEVASQQLPSDEVSKSGTVVLDELSSDKKTKRHRRTKAEMMASKIMQQGFMPNTNPEVQKLLDQVDAHQYEQTNLIDYLASIEESVEDSIEEINAIEKVYEKIPEGSIVRNIYSNRDYKVVKASDNNVVEVFDKDHGYLTLARSDIKVLVNIPGMVERN